MENPHAERQAILLERIVKSADKCTELILEFNHCIQEILRANENVNIAADLVTKYRKNVQYNLEAMRDLEGEEEHATIS
ncbi:uncharacterized protein STEHIDRAFT_172109 [Stereum hirsutum FP-91666 SS1]|uniref:uncharacterized protein n=1 Tax=Stereum hirsutum (strain FP-91666) TaxID=721885 RepID=UPI000444987A|nr:uncharacterized protein STEHIDRAFT_172109 [Stereum hirsutum FP-91666 SS1]EIM81073.1 hypothetical protein STEHIDRAFT_172109 [Stereum hirsutum FP-91666 SS1]